MERQETREWLEALDFVLSEGGPERVQRLLEQLETHAHKAGVEIPFSANTPYINTIPAENEPPYPGHEEIERRIENIIRWNAMAMVVRANKESDGIGGHIATYASSATLYEVGLHHFFKGRNAEGGGDQVYFQGHASPGMYARAFLEGRLGERDLMNFRQELRPDPGLSSYPHPWLMPEFWQFPTVSMGLGPIMAIYQARFNRYLLDRGIKDTSNQRVWCFIGDGECDEAETLGAITLPARERLDNLTFVINCNLQRLDGPVRGNGKIIQELEAAFRGAGWNVIKVIWGRDWDPLLAQDTTGELVERMGEVVDGQYQKYTVESGAYAREHFFGKSPRLLEMASRLTDQEIRRLRRGGHDPRKVYAAYKAAVEHKGQPSVILAMTVKGYGMGEAGEGRNVTHQQKKMNEEQLMAFRTRFNVPVSDEEVAKTPFYRFPDDSREMQYLCEHRQKLGGPLPKRIPTAEPIKAPGDDVFEEFYQGSGQVTPSTTGAYVTILSKLLRHPEIGKLIVPIIPDEARTFGMDSLFPRYGIYSHVGQLYEPVDRANLAYYKEAKNGQILEEGINEAGSMASFIAAGTAYTTHGINMIPFYIYYSMFGQQRVGDLFWAAGDLRCRGFLLGGTAGRTTLSGEGLQHQDGHSHLFAYAVPNLMAYDPAYAYEMAVIIQDGIKRMYQDQESLFYYITVMNENYVQPPMPEGDRDAIKRGILNGMHKFKAATVKDARYHAQLFGSGTILNKAVQAQQLLGEQYGVAADVWSVTSYKALYCDGNEADRWNLLHPGGEPRVPWVTQCLADAPGVLVAASDYVKALPESVDRWMPRRLTALGTDGFGRSDNRGALRDFFEVDHRFYALATLSGLAREKKLPWKTVHKAMKDLKISPDKADPLIS